MTRHIRFAGLTLLVVLVGLAATLGPGQTQTDIWREWGSSHPVPDEAARDFALVSSDLPPGFAKAEPGTTPVPIDDAEGNLLSVHSSLLEVWDNTAEGIQISCVYCLLDSRLQASQALRGYLSTKAIGYGLGNLGDLCYQVPSEVAFIQDRAMVAVQVDFPPTRWAEQDPLRDSLAAILQQRISQRGFQAAQPLSVSMQTLSTAVNQSTGQVVRARLTFAPLEFGPARYTFRIFGPMPPGDPDSIAPVSIAHPVERTVESSESSYEFVWDGTNDAGQPVEEGQYGLGVEIKDILGRPGFQSADLTVQRQVPPIDISTQVSSTHVKPRKGQSLDVAVHANRVPCHYVFSIYRQGSLFAQYALDNSQPDYRFVWNGVAPSGEEAHNGSHELVIVATDPEGHQDNERVHFEVNL